MPIKQLPLHSKISFHLLELSGIFPPIFLLCGWLNLQMRNSGIQRIDCSWNMKSEAIWMYCSCGVTSKCICPCCTLGVYLLMSDFVTSFDKCGFTELCGYVQHWLIASPVSSEKSSKVLSKVSSSSGGKSRVSRILIFSPRLQFYHQQQIMTVT